MNFLLIGTLIILLIVKIKILRKELKENKKKLWPIYFSSLFAEVTSLLGVGFIQANLMGTRFDEFIIFIIISLACIVENIILLIVGIIFFIKQKKKIKNKSPKEKNYIFLKIFITFISVWIFSLLISYTPKLFKSELEKYIEDYVVEYMTKKYGDGNFKVLNIAKNYSGGLWEPEVHSGYYVKIKNSYTNNIISMFIDGTTKETIKVSYDGLLLDYYEKIDEDYGDITYFQEDLMNRKIKIVEDAYQKQFNVDIDFSCYYKIPDNYGHIPSIDELVELCPVNTDHISVTVNDHVEKKNELDYLKRLAKYSMNYFKDEEEVNIYYTLNYRNGFIKINYSTITIKLDNEEKLFSKEEIENYTK